MPYAKVVILCFCYLLIETCGPEKDRFKDLMKVSYLGLLLSLLGQQNSLDVGEDTTLGNGDTSQQLVQFLVIADGQLEMAGDDPGLLVVTGSIASQLKDLSSQILHHGSQVDRGASTHTLGIVALAQEPVDPTHGELQTSPVGTGLGLSLDLTTFAAARHDEF